MFRRYSHGHSIFLGLLVGLLLTRHVWLVALLCFGGGLVVGRAWGFFVMVEEAVRARVLRARREHIPPGGGLQPVYPLRSVPTPGDLPEDY